MAVGAYILIHVEKGKVQNALQIIRKIEGVKQAHSVTGLHDIIAYVETTSLKNLGNLVLAKIQGIEGVSRTNTCVTVEG